MKRRMKRSGGGGRRRRDRKGQFDLHDISTNTTSTTTTTNSTITTTSTPPAAQSTTTILYLVLRVKTVRLTDFSFGFYLHFQLVPLDGVRADLALY